MEKLSTIFDSSARVKVMRLFLFNETTPFDIEDLMNRSHIARTVARKEMTLLTRVGFIKAKDFTKTRKLSVSSHKGKGRKKKVASSSKRVHGWMLNKEFPLVQPLRTLLLESELIHTKELPKRFGVAGNIKMLVLSGIFMKNHDQHMDMIVVGERLNMHKLDKVLRTMEAEIGKELRYAIFTPQEFQYRLQMYDQHLLDIFQAPHDRVVDKLGVQI